MFKNRCARVVGSLAVIGASVTGCSSSNGVTVTGTAPASELLAVLGRIAATDDSRGYVEFGRPKDVTAANGSTKLSGAYGRLFGYGASGVRALFSRLPDVVGFDPQKADVGVVVGEPPNVGGLFIGGFDEKTVDAKLTALGGTATPDSGATIWRLRADDSFNLDDPLGKALPQALSRLNVIRIDGAALTYGASSEAVGSVDGTAPDLLSADQTYVDVAACLGDPLVAMLTDKAGASDAVVGLGVSGARGDAPLETLCVATASDADATALVTRLTTALKNGVTPSTKRPYTDLLTDTTVSVIGGTSHVVRMTAHSAKAVDVLFSMFLARDLAGLIGS